MPQSLPFDSLVSVPLFSLSPSPPKLSILMKCLLKVVDDGHSSSIDFPKAFSTADFTTLYYDSIMVVQWHNFRQLQITASFLFNDLLSNIPLFSLKTSVSAYLYFDVVRADDSSACDICQCQDLHLLSTKCNYNTMTVRRKYLSLTYNHSKIK